MLASSKCQRSWNNNVGAAFVPRQSGHQDPSHTRNDQSFPDLDWLRIATRKLLQPIARQGLDLAAKFLKQRRRIPLRAACDFQFQTLTPGFADDHELAESARLKEVFVRFNPMQFGSFAPQIHRKNPIACRLGAARLRQGCGALALAFDLRSAPSEGWSG